MAEEICSVKQQQQQQQKLEQQRHQQGGGEPVMRCRQRRLTRREKWPFHVGLFLLYVLIQTIRSVQTSKPTDETISISPPVSADPRLVKFEEDINKVEEIAKDINNLDKTEKDKNKVEEITKDINKLAKMEKDIDKMMKEIKQSNENDSKIKTDGNKINLESLAGSDKQRVDLLMNKETAYLSTENPKNGKPRSDNPRDEPKANSKGENNSTGQKTRTTTAKGIQTTATTPQLHDPRPTMRPRRPPNCSAPAIEQFPRPLMSPESRKHGGLIIHVLVAVYTFLGLAIVCDDYFVSSLDRICEGDPCGISKICRQATSCLFPHWTELRLSPDVAGATFMAAGSSAPELATVVIGVFFAKDDIGVSGVIGSAVFNIMFVISVCGLCSGTVSKLNWWPLCRDCFFYAVSILVMLGTIYNESISWPEALFMLITYCVYCVVLSFNAPLERWAKSLNLPYLPKDSDPAEESALVSYRSLQEERLSYTGPNSPITDQVKSEGNINGVQDPSEPPAACPKPANPPQPQYYKAKEPDPNEISPLVKPTDGGKWGLFSWGLVYPIHFMCRATMPDCRQEKWKSWYPFTFCISMIWISFYSYFMVWMITIIGSTLGIPDTVMGLTFVAAGVSVPDALSSLAVIKEGLGDMAVSNAVGSNVFDILVCLGLPWFIQTAMIQPGSHVNVTSRGLTYSTVSLLSTVIFLVLATHLNGWKLDRRYGVVLMVWYLIFIAFASLYELNVFGQMNPPACPSIY